MHKQKTFVLPNPLAELNSHVSKASMLIELYEKHANSEIKADADLDHVRREMKAIKGAILSELSRSKGALETLMGGGKGLRHDA